MTITSSHNQHLKEIRKLRTHRRTRDQAARFVAEGEDLLAAADAAGWQPIERYAAAGSGLEGTEVEPRLLAQASGLASGAKTLAVYKERWAPRPTGPLCVYLHGVHDPGNVGTILRSAEAFGADSVAIGPGTADPYSPKAVRASMGAIFGVPLARAADIGDLPGRRLALVANRGEPLSAASGREPLSADSGGEPLSADSGGEPLSANSGREPLSANSGREPRSAERGREPHVTLMIGAERDGLPEEAISQAHVIAHIPIRTHSLNAAMAATVALYEVAAHRH